MIGKTCWRLLAGAGMPAVGIVVATVAVPIQAQAASKGAEATRVRMVDECVYSEWQFPARRKSAAVHCKCAAKKAISSLSPEDRVDTGWGGGLTRKQTSAWRFALKSCR